jgi:predicted DNA-binding transcriptional regulator AlpA
MPDTATSSETHTPEPTEVELWTRESVLKFFGGERPLHLSTLYRGIERGIYPRPVYVSANSVRWVASECHAARQRMLDERESRRPVTGRGRPRLHRLT